MTQPFLNNGAYLAAELSHLDLLLRREVLESRCLASGDQSSPFRGMYISDAEIERSLGTIQAPKPDSSVLDAAAHRLCAEIDGRARASMETGIPLALPQLARVTGLSAFEQAVVVLALAPELDLKYERIFAYLQDDLTRKRPSPDLAVRVLCPTVEDRLRRREAFGEYAPLRRARILRPLEYKEASFLAAPLVLDRLIVDYLLQSGGTDRDCAACIDVFQTARDLETLRWDPALKARLLELVRNYLDAGAGEGRRLIVHFAGATGTGRKTLAACLCRRIGVPLFVVDLRESLRRFEDFEDILARLLRQCLLSHAAVYLEGFDQLLPEEGNNAAHRLEVRRCIEEMSWLTFIGTGTEWASADLFKSHLCVTVELPFPDAGERTKLWSSLAGDAGRFESEVDWAELAVKFRLTPGSMESALSAAGGCARLRGPAETPISRDDLFKACYAQSNRGLASLARKLVPRCGWKDIVLPRNALAQLREICAQVKHRQTVYGDWGFGDRLSLGKGLCAFFHGQSGVGKTMAVEIVAAELHLEAFKIDLANVVSKYIGETEKNLGRIFHEAETSNAILFFDEADALFGKRSEVKDAHDRYANIEINYLLQRMEEFEGLMILATNLRKNIDEAFFRRIHFAVEFPFPDAASRYDIWRRHFPDAAPRSADIDFGYLAERFVLTGGSIRNIVVNAAFLAAENSGSIHMEHIIRATRREYEKAGRLCTDAEFAPYQSLLREA